MASVNEIITANASASRKTKNADLYFEMLCAICRDDTYVAKNTKSVNATGVVTEDMHLSTEFKRLLATAIKKTCGLSEAEAFEAAGRVELTKDQAKTLVNIVRETDYLVMKDCNKKIQYFSKPDLDVTLSIGMAPESVRPNPQDRSKSVKIEAHPRLQASQKIYEFQKKTIKTPKK